MKLLVDLYTACQTNTRFRGIGRYTLSLIRAMARVRGINDLVVLGDPLYEDSFEDLRQEFIRLLPAGRFLPYFHEPVNHFLGEEAAYKSIAETLIRQAYQVVAPDVVLYPNVLEGQGEQGLVALPDGHFPSSKRVAILYDLIPLIYQKEYLQNPELKSVYSNKLDSLKKFDLLFAISEATRQDAIERLEIQPEKIVNISGAASLQFQKLEITEEKKQSYLRRFGISRPFVLYIGGDNFRKNLEGALRAYALLPHQLINSHQLVFNDVGNEGVFREKARALGLTNEDIVITGRLEDEELIVLYNLCKLFFFPSLYEGFGLPALEAMACGAPVIASNNSSLPEIIGRSDATFDASNDQAISSVLYRVLTDDTFREELSAFGYERAKQFGWEKSAQCAWSAIDEMLEKQAEPRVTVVPEKKRRPRIAYVSPLPPQKSGISDYSADLLPYLARYFNIDLFIDPGLKLSEPVLCDQFTSYPWTELLDRRDDYATVVYQYGNSDFHSHMFQLAQDFPGVVVLHDFYLSHMVCNHTMPRGTFRKELDYNHGLKSIIEYVKKDTEMLWDWPLNRRVLRHARQLIVHSKFHNQLLNRFYHKGWQPSPSIINQVRLPVPEVTADQRRAVRLELGIENNKFLFCTFGLITSSKLTLLILQAFSIARDALGEDAMLIFVGECVDKAYHQQVMDWVDTLNLNDRVCITGFVDIEIYKKYLICADVAMQLRIKSRGETSRAVLDCMAYGIPTVVNAHGTVDDYRDEDLVKLKDPLNIDELAQALIKLKKDDGLRLEKSRRSRKVIAEQHNPEVIAAAYADVIHRAIQTDERSLFAPMLDTLAKLSNPNDLVETQANLAAKNYRLRCQPRILVDVSYISTYDHHSGIQRVVKSLIRELFLMDDPSLQIEPVRIVDGQLLRSTRFIEELLNLPEQSLGIEVPIPPQPGDILLMLDSSWFIYEQFLPIFCQIRQNGGKILTMVYDLLPINIPDKFDQITSDALNKWVQLAIAQSDTLVCISRSVADDVVNFISENRIDLLHQLNISYIHLGADISVVSAESSINETVKRLVNNFASPLFLMVGTIEPRKGHAFALDAFELLWKQGYDFCLCIAGGVGWNVAETEHRIRKHPELGKRLFFIEKPTDAEIKLCYSAATALITASAGEGYGLPIVEAAQFLVPVLASDIPVFREVGGEGAFYFSLASSENLTEMVKHVCSLTAEERSDMAKKIKVLSWKESAVWLLNVINNEERTLQGFPRIVSPEPLGER